MALARSKGGGSLFGAAERNLDPALSKLFSSSSGPVQAPRKKTTPQTKAKTLQTDETAAQSPPRATKHQQHDGEAESSSDEANVSDEQDTSEVVSDEAERAGLKSSSITAPSPRQPSNGLQSEPTKRQRKRRRENDNLESDYLQRLAREEEKEAERQHPPKRVKQKEQPPSAPVEEVDSSVDSDADDDGDGDVPMHETLALSSSNDQTTSHASSSEKAASTVFLANVSTAAITSKAARKALVSHLTSFIPSLPPPPDGTPPYKLTSLRFRSTPYADPHIPKRASYSRAAVHAGTTPSTHAYAVFSSPHLAALAVPRLNGTIVLDRHLRADSAASPAPIIHRRCVFVGNLGFVDSPAEDGQEQTSAAPAKQKKTPKSDTEEGLWRLFNAHTSNAVTSVRVVRDPTTRVGKGFAYVQFADENGVEKALLCDGKRFPEYWLPRTLRVSRARKGGDARKAGTASKPLSSQQQRQPGRGQHQHAPPKKDPTRPQRPSTNGGGRQRGPRPGAGGDDTVFEGHRASSASRTALAQPGRTKKKKKTGHGARRGAAWKRKTRRAEKGGGGGGT